MFGKDLILKNKTEVQEKTTSLKTFVPEVDIFENEKELVLVADMPGVDKKHMSIQLEDNTLTLRGEIQSDNYEGQRPIYSEYNIGHYERRFNLSESIDQEKVSAKMENGSLILSLPKAQKVLAKTIAIQ